jgi:hypothetical protein
MNELLSLTAAQLKHAAGLKEKIVELENELASLLGSDSPVVLKRGRGRPRKGVITSARPTGTPEIKRRKMSGAARAKMARAAKARWAKVKAAGKNSL